MDFFIDFIFINLSRTVIKLTAEEKWMLWMAFEVNPHFEESENFGGSVRCMSDY